MHLSHTPHGTTKHACQFIFVLLFMYMDIQNTAPHALSSCCFFLFQQQAFGQIGRDVQHHLQDGTSHLWGPSTRKKKKTKHSYHVNFLKKKWTLATPASLMLTNLNQQQEAQMCYVRRWRPLLPVPGERCLGSKSSLWKMDINIPTSSDNI